MSNLPNNTLLSLKIRTVDTLTTLYLTCHQFHGHLQAASMDKAERTFGRSSFTCARPYEAKQQRPRRRTFIMADLQPTSNSHVALVESDDFKSFTDSTGSLWTVGNAVLKNIMGSSLYQSTAGVCCS